MSTNKKELWTTGVDAKVLYGSVIYILMVFASVTPVGFKCVFLRFPRDEANHLVCSLLFERTFFAPKFGGDIWLSLKERLHLHAVFLVVVRSIFCVKRRDMNAHLHVSSGVSVKGVALRIHSTEITTTENASDDTNATAWPSWYFHVPKCSTANVARGCALCLPHCRTSRYTVGKPKGPVLDTPLAQRLQPPPTSGVLSRPYSDDWRACMRSPSWFRGWERIPVRIAARLSSCVYPHLHPALPRQHACGFKDSLRSQDHACNHPCQPSRCTTPTHRGRNRFDPTARRCAQRAEYGRVLPAPAAAQCHCRAP
ncbi:hypothetical protein D3C71_1302340 [compost metagenome]